MNTLGAQYDADRFDVAHALHHFCMDYHGGQWSRLYRIGCKVQSVWGFKDSPLCMGLETHESGENDIAILIYGDLEVEFGKE